MGTESSAGSPDVSAYLRLFNTPRTILVVDDRDYLLEKLFNLIRVVWPAWKVVHAATPEETLNWLHAWVGSGEPDLVSVDLGLEPRTDDTSVGLELLQEIHADFPSLPLAVHSLLRVEDVALHRIITIPASYISLQDPEAFQAFAMVLPLLVRGYLVYSPQTALKFSSAIVSSRQTDPLSDDDWELLKWMAHIPSLTYKEIGNKMGLGEAAIWARVHKIAEELNKKGFIQVSITSVSDPRRYRSALARFHRDFYVRFGRE